MITSFENLDIAGLPVRSRYHGGLAVKGGARASCAGVLWPWITLWLLALSPCFAGFWAIPPDQTVAAFRNLLSLPKRPCWFVTRKTSTEQ